MSDSKELKVGDVVRLPSGGPLMTVDAIIAQGESAKASCVWFSALSAIEMRDSTDILPIYTSSPSQWTFAVEALVLVEDPSKKA